MLDCSDGIVREDALQIVDLSGGKPGRRRSDLCGDSHLIDDCGSRAEIDLELPRFVGQELQFALDQTEPDC